MFTNKPLFLFAWAQYLKINNANQRFVITAIPCRFFYSSCKRGPVRACSLSPLKFKMGVRDKSPTPINSPLILFPFTATI